MAVASSLERGVRTRNLAFLLAAFTLAPLPAFAALYAVIVEGLGGDEQYARQFREQVETIRGASLPLATGG